jgi:hypothetical protein
MNQFLSDVKQLYDLDYLQWLSKTVEQLKKRQLEQLDYEHLIEELEALGRSEKSAVESLLMRIIQHLLLYQYWHQEREYNGRHWQTEILTFRTQIELKLTNNLKQHLQERLDYLYNKARKIAELKSELHLPEMNPYKLEQILEEDWWPDIDLKK